LESISDRELDDLLAIGDGRHFLSNVVEPLADSFDPAQAEVYEALFTRAIARVASELLPRVRPAPRNPLPASAERVYVLSRITLGADVAVTSVLIDAAKLRYPRARIVFVGPRKNYGLFEADPRVEHMEAPYARSGSLRDRLTASAALWFDDGVVIDPDSRLTQLGLIRVCEDERYCFFPSRSFDGMDRLPELAARWAGAGRPYIAPRPATGKPAEVTVSLGVGENLNKRMDDAFESDLFDALDGDVLVDLGGNPDERARVQRVLRPGMRTHDGAFAPFAAEIARSKLFIGYDSAGGHVASACGVPVISIAKGFLNERMAARWRPLGTIVKNIEGVRAALATYRARR
jgi:hypothetical protein